MLKNRFTFADGQKISLVSDFILLFSELILF